MKISVGAHPVLDQPSARVLQSFGLVGPICRLPGGLGRTLRVGDAVLKLADDVAEAEWIADVLHRMPCDGFRVARPLRAADGRWSAGGWTASQWLVGRTGSLGRWHVVLQVGRAFHRALASTPRPAFLGRATHRYAVADRFAWDEQQIALREPVAGLVDRLRERLRPVDAPSQIVHGDLSENILFAPGSAPAVIDFSPYWRPAAFAEGVVIADAMVWSDGGPELITDGELYQMTLRALVFRLAGLHLDHSEPDLAGQVARFSSVVELICRLRR